VHVGDVDAALHCNVWMLSQIRCGCSAGSRTTCRLCLSHPRPALADTEEEEEPENNADRGVGNGKEYEKIEFRNLNLAEAAMCRSACRRDQILIISN